MSGLISGKSSDCNGNASSQEGAADAAMPHDGTASRGPLAGARAMGLVRNRPVLMVVCVALAVRLLMILWGWSSPYADGQTGMSELYFREGYAISAGYGYVEGNGNWFLKTLQQKVETGEIIATPSTVGPPPHDLHPQTLHPPGMHLLIAAVHRVLGVPANLPVALFGAVLDSAAAGILYWLVSAFWTSRVGVATALAYALFLPQAYYATVARMPGGFMPIFLIGCLASVLLAARTSGARSYAWFAAGGFAVGIASYLRPDYLLMPLGMLPFLWLYTRDWKKSLLGIGVMVVVTFTSLLPWAYRNHVAYDQWIFTSSGVGATLINGLASFDNPWRFGGSDLDRHDEAIAQGMRSPWTPEANTYFKALFIESVKEKPMAYMVSIIKRLPLAIAPPYSMGFANPLKTTTFSEVASETYDRYAVIISNTSYFLAAYWDRLLMSLVSLLCLICSFYMFMVEYRRRALVLLMMSPHLYSIGSHLLTNMEPRFLLPSMFSLLIGVGYVSARVLSNRASADVRY